ncbi:MAG: methyltransferase domain-containing protein [Acidobacteria bacterium]|nr:methyltransferase domain-containing protein [Acidobacteriota bacterium]
MKLAVFDIDGTLTGTDSVDGECFVRALEEAHAIRGVNTNWAEYPHTTDSGIVLHIFRERFGRDPDAGELIKLQNHFVELLREQRSQDATLFAEVPGAAAALQKLRQDALWGVALATGCWRASALLKLEAAGIEHDHLPAAFAEEGVSREEILRAAISKAHSRYGCARFEKVVSVGDGVWDVRAASRLELSFLGVGSGEREALLRRAGASHVIADFTDFARLTQALNGAEVPVQATDSQVNDESAVALQSSYDRVAVEYAARIYDELKDKPLDRQLLDQFAERVRDFGTTCDVGCGPGQVAAYLHACGVRVFGIDLSTGMVEQARRLNPGIRFDVGDMLSLDLADDSLAGVAAFYSIIHVPRAEVVRALRELRRVLGPGGLLLLAFHVGAETIHLEEWWGERVSVDFRFFQPDEMTAHLKSAGFEVEEVIEREAYKDVEHQSRRAYIFARKPA